MAKETTKATISLKAESLTDLIAALEAIALDAGMQIVMQANVSTSIALEAEDLSDLGTAIGDIAGAVGRTEGVECKVSAPGSVWHLARLDPTPMERMINEATR
jgi:hypothetical protein